MESLTYDFRRDLEMESEISEEIDSMNSMELVNLYNMLKAMKESSQQEYGNGNLQEDIFFWMIRYAEEQKALLSITEEPEGMVVANLCGKEFTFARKNQILWKLIFFSDDIVIEQQEGNVILTFIVNLQKELSGDELEVFHEWIGESGHGKNGIL